MNNATQCSCGTWWSDTGRGHTACRVCRATAQLKRKKAALRKPRTPRYPAPGTLEWAEARGGLIGGYETD